MYRIRLLEQCLTSTSIAAVAVFRCNIVLNAIRTIIQCHEEFEYEWQLAENVQYTGALALSEVLIFLAHSGDHLIPCTLFTRSDNRQKMQLWALDRDEYSAIRGRMAQCQSSRHCVVLALGAFYNGQEWLEESNICITCESHLLQCWPVIPTPPRGTLNGRLSLRDWRYPNLSFGSPFPFYDWIAQKKLVGCTRSTYARGWQLWIS